MAELPLKGLRVIELARILAGPWAGQTLADLGAEVIKIESKTGDDTRTWGPPFINTGEAIAFFLGVFMQHSIALTNTGNAATAQYRCPQQVRL